MADFLKIDAERLDRAVAHEEGRKTPPSSQEVDAFDRVMQRPGDERQNGSHDGMEGDGAGGDRDGGPDAGTDTLPGATASPFQLLGGAMQGLLTLHGAEAAEGAQQPHAMTDADSLASTLVERILVSSPGSGTAEIRIILGDGVLPGTEIHLARGADGLLSVSLQTTDPGSFQSLVAARDGLQQRLERLEQGQVRVEVSQEARPDDGDADRRSAGYMTQQPDEERR